MRCPDCRKDVHAFAAICPSCGTDLDVYRRRQNAAAARPGRQRIIPRIGIPQLDNDTFELVVLTAIMVVLALYCPELSGGPWGLFGFALCLFIAIHAERNAYILRRNIAIGCTALALFDFLDPSVLVAHLP